MLRHEFGTIHPVPSEPRHAGHPLHPDHELFLLRLGETAFAAAAVGSHMLNVLRTHCGHDYWELTPKTHGRLRELLEAHADDVPGLVELLPELLDAVALRNAVLHALPVQQGLQYRAKDKSTVQFYDVSDLEDARDRLLAVRRKANRVLWHHRER